MVPGDLVISGVNAGLDPVSGRIGFLFFPARPLLLLVLLAVRGRSLVGAYASGADGDRSTGRRRVLHFTWWLAGEKWIPEASCRLWKIRRQEVPTPAADCSFREWNATTDHAMHGRPPGAVAVAARSYRRRRKQRPRDDRTGPDRPLSSS